MNYYAIKEDFYTYPHQNFITEIKGFDNSRAQIALDNNLFGKKDFKFKPLDKKLIDQIVVLQQKGQYPDAYRVIYSNIENDSNVPNDIKYWFKQASEINSNKNSVVNDFIRIYYK